MTYQDCGKNYEIWLPRKQAQLIGQFSWGAIWQLLRKPALCNAVLSAWTYNWLFSYEEEVYYPVITDIRSRTLPNVFSHFKWRFLPLQSPRKVIRVQLSFTLKLIYRFVCVVTGAGSKKGVGRSTVFELAAHGVACIYACDLDDSNFDDLISECKEQYPNTEVMILCKTADSGGWIHVRYDQ